MMSSVPGDGGVELVSKPIAIAVIPAAATFTLASQTSCWSLSHPSVITGNELNGKFNYENLPIIISLILSPVFI